MKLTIDDAVVDVAFNPAGKNDGRPDAGMSYTASLRADSTTGGARLTVGTDFTPPCVLAVLPEWSISLAYSVLGLLGFYAPSQSGWMVARDGVYAYADGMEYVEPHPEELAFMASFGFAPGARFNLALPMLRAQRAQFWSDGLATIGDALALDAIAAKPDSVTSPAPDQGDALTASAVDAGEKATAQELEAATAPAPGRRRRTARPKEGTLVITSVRAGQPTTETLIDRSGVQLADPVIVPLIVDPADVPADDEVNPFAVGGA